MNSHQQEILGQYASMLEDHGEAIALGVIAGSVIGSAVDADGRETGLAAGMGAIRLLELGDTGGAADREARLRDLIDRLLVANGAEPVGSEALEGVPLQPGDADNWVQRLTARIDEFRKALKPWDLDAITKAAWTEWYEHFKACFARSPATLDDAARRLEPSVAYYVAEAAKLGPAALPLRFDVGEMTIADWSELFWSAAPPDVPDPQPAWLTVVAAAFLGACGLLPDVSKKGVRLSRAEDAPQYRELYALCNDIDWCRQRKLTTLVFAKDRTSVTATWKPAPDITALWVPLDSSNEWDHADLVSQFEKVDYALVDGPPDLWSHHLVGRAMSAGASMHGLQDLPGSQVSSDGDSRLPRSLQDAVRPIILQTQ